MPLAPGTRLGPYEIVAAIGAGGMGEVYSARDRRLDRAVAIKTLTASIADSPDARQRFEREAKAISRLSHPHICALYDVGHEGDVEYLVMELLEGETLARRLTKGPLPMTQVLRYGGEIADALAAAHRQGIVHRDLKPGNARHPPRTDGPGQDAAGQPRSHPMASLIDPDRLRVQERPAIGESVPTLDVITNWKGGS